MKPVTNITPGTIARTIILTLALANQILLSIGHSMIEIQDETITELVSTTFTVITAVVAWWKNNSFTENARLADEHLVTLKKIDARNRGDK